MEHLVGDLFLFCSQSLVESLTMVQKLRSDLTLDPYKSKLEAILKKNSDLQKFIEVSNVLSG